MSFDQFWNKHLEALGQTAKLILDHKSFFVCSHINPDADALGSTLAMGIALEEMGKRVYVYNESPVPQQLQFLPRVQTLQDVLPDPSTAFDATLVLDCGSMKRVGKGILPYYESGKSGLIACIDHHASNNGFGAMNLIVPEASSTSEIVAGLFQSIRHPFTRDVATCLYAGISVDTGSFMHQGTSPYTFRLCAQLVESGADPHAIAVSLYEQRPRYYFQFFGEVLKTLTFEDHLPVSWMRVEREILDQYGYDMDVTEGMIEELRSVEGMEVVILYKQNDDLNGYKVSMRSKDGFDVAGVCAQFGGGGHRRAAGVDMKGRFEDIHKKLMDAIQKQLRTH
jgi:phosphoesterase RecJ-like protein